MRVFRVTWSDHDGSYQYFKPTIKSANKFLEEIEGLSEVPLRDKYVGYIDIPTDKAGLIDWLNTKCNHGNSAMYDGVFSEELKKSGM